MIFHYFFIAPSDTTSTPTVTSSVISTLLPSEESLFSTVVSSGKIGDYKVKVLIHRKKSSVVMILLVYKSYNFLDTCNRKTVMSIFTLSLFFVIGSPSLTTYPEVTSSEINGFSSYYQTAHSTVNTYTVSRQPSIISSSLLGTIQYFY